MAEPNYVTHAELKASVSHLEASMARMETRLTMRMFTVMLIGNGITITIIGGLMRLWLGEPT